jgi:FkbH-like protein
MASVGPETSVVRSRFLEALHLDTGSVLLVHALVQSRMVVKPELAALVEAFATPRPVGDVVRERAPENEEEQDKLLAAVRGLVESRFLFPGTQEEEERSTITFLSQLFGRDPAEARAAVLKWSSQWLPRFAAPAPRGLDSFAPQPRQLDVVMVGLCDVQIEMDILREEAQAHGIKLTPIPTLETTLDVLKETAHDAVIVGSLGARHGHWNRADGLGDLAPGRYLDAAERLVGRIRELSKAPVLLHNLPVPTCLPLGYADRSVDSLVERAREINRGLVEMAGEQPDVFVLDIDAALAYAGKRRLLDDRVMTFTHLGALGWWTLLPKIELSTVHGIRPPLEQLGELGVSDPFEYDRIVAAEQMRVLAAIFEVGRRQAVLVDPDGVLWPGALADTGSPFPHRIDFGIWSYHSFYVAIHEALRALKRRGIRVGCVGRGDAETLRGLWHYPLLAPHDVLLRPEDFDVFQFGWNDVTESLRGAAEGLGVAMSDLAFVSVSGPDRARVAQEWPEMLVLGDNLFKIRGELLTHPAFQVATISDEARERKDVMVALAQRERARRKSVDPEELLRSLKVRCRVARGVEGDDLDRVHDLVIRTNQFTTTARRYKRAELTAMNADGALRLYVMHVQDRFTDYGLVGVAVAEGETIELLLMSCRVVGLGVDTVFVRAVLADLVPDHPLVRGRLLELERNAPARGVYSGNGFTASGEGLWEISREQILALPPAPAHIALSLNDIVVPTGFPLDATAPPSNSQEQP